MSFPNVIAAGDKAALLQQQAVAFVVGVESRRRILEALHAVEESRRAVEQSAPKQSSTASTPTSSCGGDLPPCYVVQRESGGSYAAVNPTGCGGNGCYGKFQFSGAWAGKLGLPLDIANATPEQQDNAARALWAGGAGCSNWDAC